jgi:hydrogenase maturation factor
LEPHHSHFVLVEGEAWGDETETMYALIKEWGGACPTVAVFAGGGEVTLQEMRCNVEQGRKMILLAGSGRKTDAVLAARRGDSSLDTSVREIAAKGEIISFDLHGDARSLASLVRESLLDPQKKH